jgi:hypothetical protein
VGIVIDSSVVIAWECDQLDLETRMAPYAEHFCDLRHHRFGVAPRRAPRYDPAGEAGEKPL